MTCNVKPPCELRDEDAGANAVDANAVDVSAVDVSAVDESEGEGAA